MSYNFITKEHLLVMITSKDFFLCVTGVETQLCNFI